MQLYDIAHQGFEHPMQVTALQPFVLNNTRGFESEVTSAKFSPDGMLIALARNDNSTHIYDIRNLLCGPLYKLRHNGHDKNKWTGGENYGVTHIEWESEWYRGAEHGLGLVSGGGDGTVLLWDLLHALGEPRKVAQAHYGITTFSLGDHSKGEKSLIVGDCGGNIHIYS